MSEEAGRERLVVFGDTPVARALVRQEAARGGEVVHVGTVPVAAAQGDATVEVQLHDDPELDALAVGEHPARVVIDLPGDDETLALLASVLDAPGSATPPPLLANLRDAALRRVLDENLLARRLSPRPRIVSTAALSAAAAVADLRTYELAYWRGQSQVHAVLIGFSRLGRECFEELVLSGIAGDLGRPRLTIVDRHPLEVQKLLDRDMPEIGLSADIVVAGFDPLTLTAGTGPLAAAESVAPVTVFVIALDDPAEAIAAMVSIARMQETDGQAVGAALLVAETRRPMFDLARPRGRPRDLGRSWAVRGGIESDPDLLDLLAARSDRLAQRIHASYRDRFGGVATSAADWAELPETFRKSNRRAAAHLPLKLWTMGLTERRAGSDPFAVEPHVHANVIAPCATGSSEDALLRRLARLEHDRWCADRRLDGWRFSEVRDDDRRLHPLLIPFDDPRFTAADIEKDAEQVRFLFGSVVRPADDGAVAPRVLGVVAGGEPRGGIGVAAAVRLCRAEKWRPILVICAALNGQEITLLSELGGALDEAGLAWRLLVPEVTRGNAALRVVTGEDETARLKALLDRGTTRFAPLGGILAPADLWADPSAPDPHAEAILSYITGRASAIVEPEGAG